MKQPVFTGSGVAIITPFTSDGIDYPSLRRLLDFYRERPVKGFLFFSSSEIYGDPAPDMVPTPEHYCGNVSPTGPRACYDEAKRFGETMCALFA